MGKSPRIEIQELFMAKCGNDFGRCFHGTIRREHDENGNPVVYGKIKVGDGLIYASASDQWQLGTKLDSIVEMILDGGLHSDSGRSYDIAGKQYFLN